MAPDRFRAHGGGNDQLMDEPTTRPTRPMLLFGGSGQVGGELLSALPAIGSVIAPRRDEADLTNPESLRDTIRRAKPWVVVNAAALTNVDRAEREPELARAVNEIAPGAIAEGPSPPPHHPYALGIFGHRTRFVATLLRDLPAKRELRIVADQVGSPTWSRSLALATVEILRSIRSGRIWGHRSSAQVLGTVQRARGDVIWCQAPAVADGAAPNARRSSFLIGALLARAACDFPDRCRLIIPCTRSSCRRIDGVSLWLAAFGPSRRSTFPAISSRF